jgi:hypothetical protein
MYATLNVSPCNGLRRETILYGFEFLADLVQLTYDCLQFFSELLLLAGSHSILPWRPRTPIQVQQFVQCRPGTTRAMPVVGTARIRSAGAVERASGPLFLAHRWQTE